jgi:hypothetical protein
VIGVAPLSVLYPSSKKRIIGVLFLCIAAAFILRRTGGNRCIVADGMPPSFALLFYENVRHRSSFIAEISGEKP